MDQIAPDMSMRSLRERAARFGGANTIRNVIAEDERAGEVIHRLRGMMKKGEVKHEPIDMNDLITSTLRLLHSELIDRRKSAGNARRPRAIAANIAQSFGKCDGRDGKCATGPTHHFDQHRNDQRRRGRGENL